MQNLNFTNPTEIIDLDFNHYLELRSLELSAHLVNGVPDYAFSLDQKLCQQLKAMTPVRIIAQSLTSFLVPFYKQIQQMESVAVSPQQLPDIYAIAEECAKRLGIGIPKIFVSNQDSLNAYTIATDNVAPIIVLSSDLAKELEPQELKFIIGHECGHIHNLHGVYNTTAELITNGLTKVILSLQGLELLEQVIDGVLKMLFLSWSRCAEITCDRAGLICCGDITVAENVLLKVALDGSESIPGFNPQEFLKQSDNVSLPIRLLQELTQTHPLIYKRIEAIRQFANCEVFYAWHPELLPTNIPTSVRSKAEVDDLCDQYISIFSKGY